MKEPVVFEILGCPKHGEFPSLYSGSCDMVRFGCQVPAKTPPGASCLDGPHADSILGAAYIWNAAVREALAKKDAEAEAERIKPPITITELTECYCGGDGCRTEVGAGGVYGKVIHSTKNRTSPKDPYAGDQPNAKDEMILLIGELRRLVDAMASELTKTNGRVAVLEARPHIWTAPLQQEYPKITWAVSTASNPGLCPHGHPLTSTTAAKACVLCGAE